MSSAGRAPAGFSEHRYRSRDGLWLYYRAYGSGDHTILCLHGLTRNSKDFHALALHLAGRYRVICPDVRGRGQSDRDPKSRHYHPGTYVRDVWRLLEREAIEHVTVIGTSLGGLMGMIMADQHPERLDALVLNDIGPELPARAVARILAYAGRTPPAPDWDEAAEQTRRAYEIALPDMPDAFWREYARLSWRENADGKPEPDVDPAVGDILRQPSRALRWMHWLARHRLAHRVGGVALDPWDSFRSVTMPCLVIHGELSDVLTADIIVRMQALKPDLEVVHVPGRGHTPLLDEPEALAAIDAFLVQIYRSASISRGRQADAASARYSPRA